MFPLLTCTFVTCYIKYQSTNQSLAYFTSVAPSAVTTGNQHVDIIGMQHRHCL